jgi:cytochrome c
MKELVSASKYRDIPDFAKQRKGHIVLQDHGDAVWFRDIKIRALKPF